jgi:hypothetical protein
LITVYRNRNVEHYPLSLEQFFYQVFVDSTFKNRSDNKKLNDTLNNTRVDIRSDKDWSISDYSKQRLTTINDKEYLTQTAQLYYSRYGAADTENTIRLPKNRHLKISRTCRNDIGTSIIAIATTRPYLTARISAGAS